jgi:hypothetical protein
VDFGLLGLGLLNHLEGALHHLHPGIGFAGFFGENALPLAATGLPRK